MKSFCEFLWIDNNAKMKQKQQRDNNDYTEYIETRSTDMR